MTIEPALNILVVEKISKAEIRKSSIVMPEDVIERFWMMKVVELGSKVNDIVGVELEAGDTIVTNPIPAIDNEILDPDNPQLKLISAQNILGRIS